LADDKVRTHRQRPRPRDRERARGAGLAADGETPGCRVLVCRVDFFEKQGWTPAALAALRGMCIARPVRCAKTLLSCSHAVVKAPLSYAA
jgi:hypothetical protein